MNRSYLIADTHFSHKKIAEKRGFSSTQEHDEFIIDNWNTTVDKKDTVWLLGDIVMGGSANLAILSRLKGVKKLVMGNHDRYPSKEYLKYFNNLYGAVQLKGCILTHIPVQEAQVAANIPLALPARYALNIHGHLHSKVVTRYAYEKGGNVKDERYFSVSCEQINYTPILLTDILEQTGRRNLYAQ